MTVCAYFREARNIKRLREGPLGCYIDLYAYRLAKDGYRRPTAWVCLRLIADLSRRLGSRRLRVSDLDEEMVARYLADRAEHRCLQKNDRSTLTKLLAVLRQAGAIAPAVPIQLSAPERIFRDFAGYLARERGLVPVSIIRHWPVIRLFLQETGARTTGDFARLDQAAVVGFVERHARDHSPAAAKNMCWSFRAFLRYLRWEGQIACDLAGAVPTIRRWRQTSLPTSLPAGHVQRVLDACDRRSAVGRRDFAILMLLVRLGLRAGEVVALTLDDLATYGSMAKVGSERRCRYHRTLARQSRNICEMAVPHPRAVRSSCEETLSMWVSPPQGPSFSWPIRH
jgi:hypothetical protein